MEHAVFPPFEPKNRPQCDVGIARHVRTEETLAPPSKAPAVFLTIFGLATIASLVALPFVAGPAMEAGVPQWGRFLGRFHPVVLHLPIGMVALVLLMEFGKLFRRDKGSSTLVPMFFTAASAVVAVLFGLLLYYSDPEGYPAELIDRHLWWGTGFACALVGCFVVKAWVDWASGSGAWIYVLSLLGSGAVMTVASHDGGSITHGKEYLTEEAPPEVRQWLGLPVEEEPEAVPAEEQEVFTTS